MVLNRKCYVYRFIDTHGKYMYVGISNSLHRRINQHLSLKSGKFNKDYLNNIQRIDYIKLDNRVIARQHEIYFINKYKSYLNIEDKFNDANFIYDKHYEKHWKTYKIYRQEIKSLSKFGNMVSLAIPYIIMSFIIISAILK